MKTSAPLLGSLALTAAIVLAGWAGCRSGTTEKPTPQPVLKPVNSPVPATAYAAVTPPPAPNTTASSPTTPVAGAPATTTVSPAAPTSLPTSPAAEPPATLPGSPDAAPTAKVAPQPPELAPGVQAVVDMVHSQVESAVLLEYVKNSTNTFELDSDDIVYLKDIGVPDEVVTAMLKRTSELRAPQAASAVETAPPAPAAEAGAAAAASPAPMPQSTYDTTVTPPAPASPPPSAPVTENYFYSALTPYGTWLYIEPYGWCWQPTVAVADRSWRPYLHGGRWVYTTAGWYWQSYYSWGWAPFHYGNWFISPACGWVWVPGCTWGPAWVTWRYSDTYCGWAPLPPGCGWSPGIGLTYWGSGVSFTFGFSLGWNSYVFCGWNDWWRPYPYRYCLPPHRAAVVYNQTTIINNYYIDKSHNTIVNEGVPPKAMPTHVRKELRKVELADVPAAGNSRNQRPERTTPDGSKLAVYRPQVPPDLKVASARPGAAPYQPVRSRSESPGLTRGNPTPEQNFAPTPARMGRPESGLSRTPQRATGPSRMESPVRAEVPGRVPATGAPNRVESPARAEAPGRGPSATSPSRTEPGRTPAATVPSRTATPAAQPGVPGRSEPRVQGSTMPSRTISPGTAAPSRRTEPPAATVSGRNTAPAGAPPAPGRGGSPETETRSTSPPTARAPLSVPPSRYQSVPGTPPSRGEALPALPGVNTAPRYAPPSRVPAPEYRSSNPAGPRLSGAPPARAPIPSVPSISPGRSAPVSPPAGFSQPAVPRGSSSPPTVFAPAPRSSGANSVPGFGGESGGRSAPAGPPPSRNFRTQ